MKSIALMVALMLGLAICSHAQVAEGDLFFWAEQMPQFPKEHGSMASFLKDNIHYPEAARDNHIEGRVYVSFVVEKDGSLSNIKPSRPGNADLDAEAVRVVSIMPMWTPGYQDGNPVRVSMSVPINFKLGTPQVAPTMASNVQFDSVGVCVNPAIHASYPGGEEALALFFKEKMVYPAEAVIMKRQGVVNVSFVVDADGSVTDVKVVEPVDRYLDIAAVKLIQKMPRWTPGEDGVGNKVKTRYVIPVEYVYKEPSTIYNAGWVTAQAPSFPGGNDALMAYLRDNVKYPTKVQHNGIQGRAYVDFVVNTNGDIALARVLNLFDKQLSDEAVRVVSEMPKWAPALDDMGSPVCAHYVVPVDFVPKNASAKKPLMEATGDVVVVPARAPAFPGGGAALKDYLAQNVRYPEGLVEIGKRLSASIWVHFVIDTDGSVSSVMALNPLDAYLVEEATRVVQDMPRWTPGEDEAGNKVKTAYTIPVRFAPPVQEVASSNDDDDDDDYDDDDYDGYGDENQERGLSKVATFRSEGGMAAIRKFINSHLVYPRSAEINGIQGRVFVSFIINEDGSVSDIKVLRPFHRDLDAEAIRVVSIMPKWTPAEDLNGVPVKMSFVIPINFILGRSYGHKEDLLW